MRTCFWSTERIRIRAAEEEDAGFLAERRKTPDSLCQWYEDAIQFPQSDKETRDGFIKNLHEFYKDDMRLFMLESPDGAYAGQLSVWETNRRAGVFRHGIFLEERFRGLGLAKDALVIVMDFYFNELNYRKSAPYVYAYNLRSQKFHEDFGFTLEARMKEEHYSRDIYHDVLFYSLFKDAFNTRHKNDLWSADNI